MYVLFIGAFIEPRFGARKAAVALFGIHLVGIGWRCRWHGFLNRKVLKTGNSPFILEMPEYHMPHLLNVRRRVRCGGMDFLQRVAE